MEIVLLRLDRIGDFILGIPSYRALRQAYPKDRNWRKLVPTLTKFTYLRRSGFFPANLSRGGGDRRGN
jgi:ADP-heptose:LPS heptosyltransferase